MCTYSLSGKKKTNKNKIKQFNSSDSVYGLYFFSQSVCVLQRIVKFLGEICSVDFLFLMAS